MAKGDVGRGELEGDRVTRYVFFSLTSVDLDFRGGDLAY